MNYALMLDNENLSLRPDGMVLSIGYCMANLDTGEYVIPPADIYVALEAQPQRHIMPSTVQWWMGQSEAARTAAFPPDERLYRTPAQALEQIREVLRYAQVADQELTVWAKPSHMDIPQLKSLFGDVEPWKHWQVRDLFTFAHAFDPEGKLKPPANTAAHVASADANWQMDYLLALWKRRAELLGVANG